MVWIYSWVSSILFLFSLFLCQCHSALVTMFHNLHNVIWDLASDTSNIVMAMKDCLSYSGTFLLLYEFRFFFQVYEDYHCDCDWDSTESVDHFQQGSHFHNINFPNPGAWKDFPSSTAFLLSSFWSFPCRRTCPTWLGLFLGILFITKQ